MGDFLKQMEVKKAISRWKWSWWTGYAWAAAAAVDGFVLQDEAGNTVIGFHPAYTTFSLVFALLIGFLAWGLHKRLSATCMIALFCFALLGAIAHSTASDTPGDIILSWAFVVLLFRGLLSVRTLIRFRNEMREALASQRQGKEVAPQHPQP